MAVFERKIPRTGNFAKVARSSPADGDKIKKLRLGKTWGVVDLAQKAGKSARSIENAEAGHTMDNKTLARIALALGVPWESLVRCGASTGTNSGEDQNARTIASLEFEDGVAHAEAVKQLLQILSGRIDGIEEMLKKIMGKLNEN